MKKIDIIRFALSNFLRRKARSMLTVLGVIIGTAAVVIMLSIGIGMNKGFEDQISSWGNLREIDVWELYGTVDPETGEYKQNDVREPLDDITLENIRSIEGVKAASPQGYGSYMYYLLRNRQDKVYSCQVQGIDAASMADFDYEILYGRLLNESDVGTGNFVMCFNVPFMFADVHADWQDIIYWYESTAEDVLPFNPVNEFDDTVKYEFTWDSNYGSGAVDTTKPRVIPQEGKCVGILAQQLQGGTDWQNYIYMDIKGMQKISEELQKNHDKYYSDLWGEDYVGNVYYDDGVTYNGGRESIYNEIMVLVDDVDNVVDVQSQINELGLKTNSAMDSLVQMQEQTKFLRSILGAIGVVAFFVAALSITNTMVMSIYERTREIGIMKVIGCKLRDIRSMFLIEAGIIGIVGGVLGVIFSYAASVTVNYLASKGGMSMMGIDASTSKLSIIPLWLDIAALILATAVGIVSGLYPAIRATRLSALEAIKNE